MSWLTRLLGGPGSGNFGHTGRPGEVGGSAVDTGRDEHGLNPNTGQRVEPVSDQPRYEGRPKGELPAASHKLVRDDGSWGSSHSTSQAITGASAVQMGIPGYRYSDEDGGKAIANRFLAAIAHDDVGAEEVLYHSFENVRGTQFAVGDTLRLPLTATAGEVASYGIRLDADSQYGQPVVFEFEKGTQMAAYGKWAKADAKDFGYVYSEAIVAGGFKVTHVSEQYMGWQHFNAFYAKPENKGKQVNIYGKVVRLTQTETFDPANGWKKRG